jgi:uncharacterized membrane protein YfcA
MTWELTLTGFLIGVLVGFTGMGGGSLMTPALVFFFDFSVITAVGTDILHGAIFKTVGSARHRQLGHVMIRLAGWLALGSVPASLAGVYLIEVLQGAYGEDQVNDVASTILGIALILGAALMVARTFLHRREPVRGPYHLTNRDRVVAVSIGLVGGFILGLTSVGSGTFFGLMLLLLYPLTAPKIVGTDIFHAAVLLWAAGLAHLWANNVNLHAVFWLSLGSIPGILIGSQLTVKLPERAVRLSLATVLTLAGIRLTLG